MYRIKQITQIAHLLTAPVINKGDYAVDATAGNGYDTLFLAENVGIDGHVYAFDVQEEALNTTFDKLKKESLEKRVSLHLTGHENLSEHVREQVSIVMYNLGYLPGGNHNITTYYQTTLESIKQALTLVGPGGLISIVLYPGHHQGAVEKENLLPYLENLPASEYAVAYYRMTDQQHAPPELAIVQRNLF
ncbi:MAG: class I SAM-dependent methyltransferase [Bacillota bacterium]